MYKTFLKRHWKYEKNDNKNKTHAQDNIVFILQKEQMLRKYVFYLKKDLRLQNRKEERRKKKTSTSRYISTSRIKVFFFKSYKLPESQGNMLPTKERDWHQISHP